MLNRKSIPITTALVCAWLAAGSADARADILCAGVSPAAQGPICSVYNALPACCKTSAGIRVRVLDDRAMDSYLCAGGCDSKSAPDIDGVYQNAAPTITLRANSSRDALIFAFAHEYGHYVWLNILTEAQRQQYALIYNRARRDRSLVSSYAEESVLEGFAEAFAFRQVQRSRIAARDPQSLSFLDSAVPQAPCCSIAGAPLVTVATRS